jgi:hypothetical protein
VSPVILPHCETLAGFDFESDEAAAHDQLDYAAEIAPLWDYVRGRLAHHDERPAPAETAPDESQWDYVRDRLVRHDERTAPAETASDELQSETERQAYRQHATFTVPEMVYPCEVLEISSEGLLFASEVEVSTGARIRLNLPYLGQVYCEIVAIHPQGMEARFVVDEGRRAELYELVAELVNHARELPLSA